MSEEIEVSFLEENGLTLSNSGLGELQQFINPLTAGFSTCEDPAAGSGGGSGSSSGAGLKFRSATNMWGDPHVKPILGDPYEI